MSRVVCGDNGIPLKCLEPIHPLFRLGHARCSSRARLGILAGVPVAWRIKWVLPYIW